MHQCNNKKQLLWQKCTSKWIGNQFRNVVLQGKWSKSDQAAWYKRYRIHEKGINVLEIGVNRENPDYSHMNVFIVSMEKTMHF